MLQVNGEGVVSLKLLILCSSALLVRNSFQRSSPYCSNDSYNHITRRN